MICQKQMDKKLYIDYCKKGLDASIIHPTSIVGPNDFKPGLPMQEMVNLANGKRKVLPNWGYNFVDVRDLCDNSNICCKKMEKLVKITLLVVSIICILILRINGRTTWQRTVLLVNYSKFVTYLGLPFEYIKSLITNKPEF